MRKAFIIFIALTGFARCSFAQSSDILWAGWGWPLGADGISTWLCISQDSQQIFTSSTGGSERWPLSYSVMPARLNTDARPDSTGPFGVTSSAGGYCAPHVAKGDSGLIFNNLRAICEWYPNSNRIVVIRADTGLGYLDVSPDGSLIAVFGTRDSLLILDRNTGKELWAILNTGNCFRFSPDGKLLLVGMNITGEGLALVDVATHKIIHRYSQFSGAAHGVAWDPAVPGMFAAEGLPGSIYNGSTALMDTSGQIHAVGYFGDYEEFNDFEFSPDGKYIVSSGGVVRVSDGQPIHLDFNPEIYDVGFLNDDTIVVVDLYSVSLYSISHGFIRGLSGGALSLAFSADGSALVGDGVLDASTGMGLWGGGYGEHQVISRHGSVAVGIDNNGEMIINLSSLPDSNIVIQDRVMIDSDGYCNPSLAFSPTETVFASGIGIGSDGPSSLDSRNLVKLWSVNDHSEIREFHDPQYRAVMGIAFSSDGSMLAASFEGGGFQGLEIWDVNNGSVLYRNQFIGGYPFFFLSGDTTLLFNGHTIYNLKSQKSIEIPNNPAWNFSTYAMLPGLKEFAGIQTVSGVPCSGIQIIDIATGNIVHTIQTPDSEIIECMAVNPVTGDVAIGGQDLIVYKAFGNDYVEEPEQISSQPLHAFASNSRITVDMPGGAERGKIFVYRSDGRCYFTAEVSAGEPSITTSALPKGDYFIVFQTASGGKYFTKVSLF